MDEKEAAEVEATRVEDKRADVETTRGEAYVSPDVDIYETEDDLVLVADVPGVAHGGVELGLEEGVLEITAHAGAPAPEGEPVHEEYRPSSFYRAFKLSEVIDAEKIEAALKDGVLTVRLPKSARAKPRKIDVKAG
jgi:HSP20 family protein